jgi:hypothetical protein
LNTRTESIWLWESKKHQHAVQLQYVGLATDLASRINGYHHKLPLITRELEIWLGEVVPPRTPGRKIKVTDRILDLSEWAHAYFLQLPLNQRKTINPPDLPITVYNRWWKTDFKTPRKHRPHPDWPDVIDFIGQEYEAKLVWFGGPQVVQPSGDFRQS